MVGRAKAFVYAAVIAALTVSAISPGCGGAGCSCVAPYPNGVSMPPNLIVENGIQVRITDQGFQFIEANMSAIVASFLGTGLCLPSGGLSFGIGSVDYCNDDSGDYYSLPSSSLTCSDGSVGCPIGLMINQIDFTLNAPNMIDVFIDLNLDIKFRASVNENGSFSCASDCDLGGASPACSTTAGRANEIHADNLQTTATIELTNDPGTRELHIALTGVSGTMLNLDLGSLAEVDEDCDGFLGSCPVFDCGAIEFLGD